MTNDELSGARATARKVLFLMLFCAVLFGASQEAKACRAYGGLIDGFVDPIPPSQVQIDSNCTFRNFPASNPLTTNISFFTRPGQNNQRWLIIFDNVVHTGQMSCNAVQGHKIWFTNGSSSSIKENCQNLLIPVEKIEKDIPPGPPTATVGVPFTYTMTIPVLFDPATNSVIKQDGSLNDLHSIRIWDDLNDTGADLTYVSHDIYWEDDGTPVPHTFSNVGGFLVWDDIPVVVADRQFIIELTVVLEDTPANAPGTQFVNTAKWQFGRLIDDVFYEPLPGEWGVSEPLTIAAPDLFVTKTGPATMNIGQPADFTIDVQNAGLIDAHEVTLSDLLPDGPTGGMCDRAPQIVSAQVLQADGTTPAPGKGPLTPGVDFLEIWSGAPACRWDLRMTSGSSRIGPGERLIVVYRAELDSDTQDGVALTNVAGAVEWFNGDSSQPARVPSNRTLTDGTVGVADHEDAHTVSTLLEGFFFEKTVANLTTGVDPTSTAAPGDTLRYTLRFRTTDQGLTDFRIFDELDAMNAPPVFQAGTLVLVSVPAGADTSATDPNGGAAGTGVVDVRNLTLAANDEAVIVFDVVLATNLANGTVATNQSTLFLSDGSPFTLSDDPNVNGVADPLVPGDEDPTRVTIVSTPEFVVRKTSADLTGDPNVLLAGETLRYTITIANVGTEDAQQVTLRDAVPTNTTYVPGSTTLNGAAVADVGGVSPLVNGMLVNAPSDPTPGSLPSDPSSAPANVATITFDVVVDPGVIDGTVISNQGFVSSIPAGLVDVPSDDPTTPIPDDPTLDVVGNFPLLYAEKRVELFGDLGTPGIVDPGDTLRYTIVIQNSASIPATGVVLTDSVPANTTYVADSTRLNGLPVGQPDGGVSPLASGIDVSSSDLTPPLPGPGAGVISPGQAATLQFDLTVDAGTPSGTLISNQAIVTSTELPDLLTDGDGDPNTGPEPTVVVVGDGQTVSITKQVSVVGGGAAVPGADLEYVVRVTNIGAVPAFDVLITDDLDVPVPGQLAYVAGSATMNGATAGVTVVGSTITADYGATYGTLAPGGVAVLRFRATLDPGLLDGTVVENTGVVTWNTPTETASASVSIVVGGIPGVSVLNGSVWHDANFDDVRDSGELVLAGWEVQLYLNGAPVISVITDPNGDYRIVGVAPNDTTPDQYELRFRAPGAGPNAAALGLADSPFSDFPHRIEDIVVPPQANLQGLNLPIDPNGVVYNSVSRTPIAGVTLTLLDAVGGTPLPSSCFDDPFQQGQITTANGYYKFDLNFGDAACPSGGTYVVDLAIPPGGPYSPGYSQIVPPTSDPTTAAFSVPACPTSIDDAIPGTLLFCEAQLSEFAPGPSVPAPSAATVYHVHLLLDNPQPGASQIFNNHIPIDPELDGATTVTKTTPLRNVTRGQLIPYAITINNVSGSLLTDVTVVDRFPAGFSYVAGSAQIDGVASEPTIVDRELTWTGISIAGLESRTIKLLLAVGAGATEGEYVNRAQALYATTGEPISGEATATVRIVPDPTFDCTDVIGKVFDDADRDGVQGDGEPGLQGVRLVTARGLRATTDEHGRYHITCAIVPNESRGSNFVLKLDDRTLPSGYRMTTEPLQVRRATRGKALRINFGATIHRVVGIDLSDAAFEPGTTVVRVQWRPRLGLVVEELRKAPSLLRLSYVADTEEPALVQQRMAEIRRQLVEAWEAAETPYPLTIEPEVFWRLGGPPPKPKVRAQGGR